MFFFFSLEILTLKEVFQIASNGKCKVLINITSIIVDYYLSLTSGVKPVGLK